MPGVDLADQKRHGRIITRKRLERWYKKIFYHLQDVALVNAHIITTTLPDYVGMTAELVSSLVTLTPVQPQQLDTYTHSSA